MGEDARVVRRLPSGCSERLRQKTNGRRMQRGPSKSSGLQRFQVMFEGKTQSSLGPTAYRVSQVVTHLPGEFHLLI